MAKRSNVPVELSESAKKVVDGYAALGMSRRAVVEKILTWFSEQDDAVRATILGTIPESLRADVARLYMGRLAASEIGHRDGNGGGGRKRAG